MRPLVYSKSGHLPLHTYAYTQQQSTKHH